MRSIQAAFLTFVLAGFSAGQTAARKPAPVVDKQKLADYLRYAEGFTSSVQIAVGDPEPSALDGFYRLVVHLRVGETKQDKVYHLTADGKHLVGDPVWDLSENPFLETAPLIPADGPSFGPPGAKITLVVFNDFQCPYCREFARTLRENLPQKYPHDVRVIFKDFPIASIHPWARPAAEAAHCLSDGKPEIFWLFHDWIFEHQGEIDPGNLREKVLSFAKEHALDPAKVGTCLDIHGTAPEVEASLKQGRALEIEQTPTFFLNGRKVPGALPWKSLDTLIQMELNRPAFIPPAAAGK
jgi:glutaredoxin